MSRFRSSHHCAAHSLANFGIKGTLAIYDSSAVFGFEVPTQTRGYNDRNFKSTALGAYSLVRFRNLNSLNVRFGPKATELAHRHEMSRCARSGLLSGKKKKMMPPSACAQA